MIKNYNYVIQLDSFQDRFNYLKLDGKVGKDTFGFDRWLNQKFYRSPEWKSLRNEIIVRDGGCDLGIPDRRIAGKIFVHHMNPINVDNIVHKDPDILNPDFLICCSKWTHDALHYGDASMLNFDLIERKPGDTIPWR